MILQKSKLTNLPMEIQKNCSEEFHQTILKNWQLSKFNPLNVTGRYKPSGAIIYSQKFVIHLITSYSYQKGSVFVKIN